MIEFVRIKSGAKTARMLNRQYPLYVVIRRSEESPGEGFYPVEKIGPKPVPTGREQLGYTYTLDETRGVMRKEYFLETPPRTFSKLRLVAALMDAGYWTQVKAFIEARGLMDLYLAAQTFREDDPHFAPALEELKSQLAVPDEEVEKILSAAQTD